MDTCDKNYLLDKKVVIYQPVNAYHASTDAVWLAAAVNKIRKGDTILDVGSGTGAVALCLAQRFRDFCPQITGIEQQAVLAAAAQKSAKANGFDNVSFINENIFKTLLKPCSFAHVITNPPYADTDSVSPNSSKAAAHNLQGGTLAEWLNFCIKMLKPQGHFYIINRTEALEDILAQIHGRLGGIEVFPLYSKAGQPAKRIIVRAQKDSRAPLIVHSETVIHNPDSTHTLKAEAVLRAGEAL